jgi:hypothetical protein
MSNMRRAHTCYYYYYYVLYRRTRINPLTPVTGSRCFFRIFFSLSILLFIRLLLVSLFILFFYFISLSALFMYRFISTRTIASGPYRIYIYTKHCNMLHPIREQAVQKSPGLAEAPFTVRNTIVPGKS